MRRLALTAALLALPAAFGADDPAPEPPAAPPVAEDAAAAPATSADASPRAQYNQALAALQTGAFEEAAAGFLAARDAAGTDATLRYRAAFNLGLALAAQADAAADAKPAATLETLRGSAAWFHDAARLAPEQDDAARVNLELVLKRIERLADSLNRRNTLQARLDAVIDDQRGVRDGIRGLLTDIHADGAGAEPTGFRADFEALAARERALLAEASAVADLGAAERGHLGGLDAPTPGQVTRQAQLEGMERYLQRSRQSLGDARRRLRRLEGERAHRRADAALHELKRAREQLQDPLATLQAIVRDELALLDHTAALAAFTDGRVSVADGDGPAAPPPWLTLLHLVNRQEDAAARTGATLRGVEAAATAEHEAGPSGEAEPPKTAAAQRVRQAAAEALPHLSDGLAAMRDAIDGLENGTLGTALEAEAKAVRSLHQAIERFADLRGLIELAYAAQSQATALLTPPPNDAAADPRQALSAADRARAVTELAEDNRKRLMRLAPLLRETLTPSAGNAAGPGAEDADAAAAEQRFEAAETHRTAALRELDALLGVLAAHAAAGTQALPRAQAALGEIEALRRIYFSFVEHLQALIVEQADTHDRTATLQFESQIDQLAPELALVARRQAEHAASGAQLAAALAERADSALAQSPEPEGTQSADADADPATSDDAAAAAAAREALAKATAELRAGAANMHGAGAILAAGVQAAATASPDLEPALNEQLAAIERLESALKLLQPPRQDETGDEGSQQEGPQGQPEPSDAERMSQRQAMRRLQAIRDRDAQRRRDRRETRPPDPVEKDW